MKESRYNMLARFVRLPDDALFSRAEACRILNRSPSWFSHAVANGAIRPGPNQSPRLGERYTKPAIRELMDSRWRMNSQEAA